MVSRIVPISRRHEPVAPRHGLVPPETRPRVPETRPRRSKTRPRTSEDSAACPRDTSPSLQDTASYLRRLGVVSSDPAGRPRACLGWQPRCRSCLGLFDELRIAQFIDPGSSPWLVRVQGRTAPAGAWGKAPAKRLHDETRAQPLVGDRGETPALPSPHLHRFGVGPKKLTPHRFSSIRSGCCMGGKTRCSQSWCSQSLHVTPTGTRASWLSTSTPSE